MCRLAYIPSKVKLSKGELTDLLQYLEDQCGGDGNGYLLLGKRSSRLSKSVKLSCRDIVRDTYNEIRRGASMIFHTRKVSVGWLSDEQCHPHRIGGKYKGHIAHNGTWGDGAAIAAYLGCGSDSIALARCVGKYGIRGAEIRGLFPRTGVFLVELDGDLRAIKKSGDLVYHTETGIFASDVPIWMHGAVDVAAGSHSLLAAPPEEVRKPANMGTKSIWAKASAISSDWITGDQWNA